MATVKTRLLTVGKSYSNVSLIKVDCNDFGAPSYYKTTSVNNLADNVTLTAQIVPTLITNKAADLLTCKVSSPIATQLNITVFNLMGQMVYNKKFDVKTGETILNLSTENFANGINILKITNGSEVVNTTKLTVLN